MPISVLVHPIVSEKSTRAEAGGVYTFAVTMRATKTQICQAVEVAYKVRPIQIRTSVVEGKATRSARGIGRRVSWKKAIITLPKGKTISIHSGV
ncbi:MAG: 50S ribosomal protein L23 [Candidatus Magasanikbacteria bacterium RIFCSPHIGHO2_01_FULL_41_23]|uniref:Large ribosomal subunit protein uL23 n=1 Tax=Candidatus Magasanikbacteria bacterium RIFCSPLOWO2_01_FULL_40_15 TaxID=1798686 RepID=A0A1F6N2A1_9BACT|nr:MAG: 50S ribosomal protein L23 [Candidatus Magasanikbacteria bacterium RIFCSPHIGHO2_01_FULL_41_23]OGH66814.1 MAG: 50S ribosomal protein L23 [Candidatus Magasanikbacteria bacterium RIFCSPHIGHO2_02_FULL_41_35]OGH76666.1 MAG: 50S ribosomal protein L23 [Candidatus Magasanikbacteria bacterium RIFCSPHIGHO2_12_FULL_41_16]OGH78002.1 MAG: 50S ribosomal protein L23 [Candidatus Magasanikbacteria bacterium RIFCSPLOWO2_01_FULL_40_15]